MDQEKLAVDDAVRMEIASAHAAVERALAMFDSRFDPDARVWNEYWLRNRLIEAGRGLSDILVVGRPGYEGRDYGWRSTFWAQQNT